MTNEKRERMARILEVLREKHSDAPITYLDHKNPFEMLIATILSARTTDAYVNKVTPELFRKYPTAEKLAEADIEDIRRIIYGVGAYNNKAVFIKDTAMMLVEAFDGNVPQSIEEIVKLKGASRKTANVVLQVAFGINEGVVVDTHIRRVSQRLGLTEQEKPEKIERDLMGLLPQSEWGEYARLIGAHGRRICGSRKPKCHECPVSQLCPSSET